MKLNWATVATALMAVSAGMSVVPYGWAHITAAATSTAAMSLVGTYIVMARKN